MSDLPKPTRQRVFEGVRFCVDVVAVQTESGKTVRRDLVVHPGAVVVLPILDDGRIVMIRNYRFAVGRVLWELPAGTLEPPEPPQTCAGRELIEEAGYEAERIELLVSFYTTPGICDERMHAFVATGLRHVGQALEEHERIEVEPVEPARLEQLLREGAIEDGKTLATLLYHRVFGG